MNKKISTLLVGVASICTVSAFAQGVTEGQYYHLKAVAGGVENYVVSRVNTATSKDSTVYVAGGTYEATSDASLWLVTPTKETGNYVYKFVNKQTSATLTVKGKTVFAMADAVTPEKINEEIGANLAGAACFYNKEVKNDAFFVTAPGAGRTLVSSPTSKTLTFFVEKPAIRKMTVQDLNEMTPYAFPMISKATGVDVKTTYLFEEVGNDTKVFKIKADAGYVIADSAYYPAKSTVIKESTMLTESLDSLKAFGYNFAIETAAKNKRNAAQFVMWLNPANDSVFVQIVDSALTRTGVGADGELFTATDPATTFGQGLFVGQANFNDGADVYTTVYQDGVMNAKYGIVVSDDRPSEGELAAWDPMGKTYFITNSDGKLFGYDWAGFTTTNTASYDKHVKSAYLPESYYYVTRVVSAGKVSYTIQNAYYDATPITGKKLYTVAGKPNTYTMDGEEVTFEAVTPMEAFKEFKDYELKIRTLGLQVLTTLGSDAWMVEKDSLFYGQEGAKDNSFMFSIVPDTVGVESPSDSIKYHVYNMVVRDANGVDTGRVVLNNEGKLELVKYNSSTANSARLVFKAVNENEYKILCTNTWNAANKVASLGTFKGDSVLKADETNYYVKATAYAEATKFNVADKATPVYETIAEGDYFFIAGFDTLTNANGLAKFMQVHNSELQLPENFALYVQEAQPVTDQTVAPMYNILCHQKYNGPDTITGHFLTVNTKAEMTFNGAKMDSVFFKDAKMYNDSIFFGSKAAEKVSFNKDGQYIATFLFKKADDGYVVVPATQQAKVPAIDKVLAILNGVVYATNEADAPQVIKLASTELTTDNEDITASSISVIAVEGGVKIIGAAGKKVAISNVLGQQIANTIISSDEATISAPKGYVTVAVEGEAAVKAIVK